MKLETRNRFRGEDGAWYVAIECGPGVNCRACDVFGRQCRFAPECRRDGRADGRNVVWRRYVADSTRRRANVSTSSRLQIGIAVDATLAKPNGREK